MKAIGRFLGPNKPTRNSERTQVARLFATIFPSIAPRMTMGTMEPSVLPIPFWMAAMLSSIDMFAAMPSPRETHRKAKNACNFATEIRRTKIMIARLMRIQILMRDV